MPTSHQSDKGESIQGFTSWEQHDRCLYSYWLLIKGAIICLIWLTTFSYLPPILCYLLMRRVFIHSCRKKSFERQNYSTLIIFICLQTFCPSHLMTFMTYLRQRDTIRGMHLPCNYMEEILHVANSLWSLISYLSSLSPYIGLCGICFFNLKFNKTSIKLRTENVTCTVFESRK